MLRNQCRFYKLLLFSSLCMFFLMAIPAQAEFQKFRVDRWNACLLEQSKDLKCLGYQDLKLKAKNIESFSHFDGNLCLLRSNGKTTCYIGGLFKNPYFALNNPVVKDPIDIVHGDYHVCFLGSGGELKCLGTIYGNIYYTLREVKKVRSYQRITCALLKNNQLKCKDYLGHETFTTNGRTSEEEDDEFKRNVADFYFYDRSYDLAEVRPRELCVIKLNGDLICRTDRSDPSYIIGKKIANRNLYSDFFIDSDVKLVASSHSQFCYVKNSGEFFCIPNPRYWRKGYSYPQELDDIIKLEVDGTNACAIRVNGQHICWGYTG